MAFNLPHGDEYMQALERTLPLTRENASGFVACVEEMAAKAGIKGTVNVELVPTNVVNATFRNTANGGTLGFSEGLFHLLENTNLHGAPNAEMKAIIGHELSHMRHRWGEWLPNMALMTGLPLAGMGAMYLFDKTNEKLRKNNQLHPDKPQAFWDAFHETIADVQKAGAVSTINDYLNHSLPLVLKALHYNPLQVSNNSQPDGKLTSQAPKPAYEYMSWGEATLEQAKYIAVNAACTIPALAACRNLSFAHEFRADKFAVALNGDKAMASALKKLAANAEQSVGAMAKTPLEKSWARRTADAIWEYVNDALRGTHPPTTSRVAAIESTNIVEAVQHFRL